MINTARYNYFNLLIQISIGIAALAFVVFKIDKDFYMNQNNFDFNNWNWFLIFIAFVLSFANWSIESIKWKYLMCYFKPISFLESLKIVITGITISLITPNRIGEIPVRAYLLQDKTNLKHLVYYSFLGSFSQLIVTWIIGTIGLIVVVGYSKVELSLLVMICVVIVFFLLLLVAIFPKPIKKAIFKWFSIDESIAKSSINMSIVFLLSLSRYSIFILQFWLLFEALHINFQNFLNLWLIPVFFLLSSSVPTFVLSELGVRGSIAILIFSSITSNNTNLVAATTILWIINIGIPAIIGVFGVKRIKLMSK